jgi:hypothetical protein
MIHEISQKYHNFCSFQLNIPEYLCIFALATVLTLLVDLPFGNVKKILFNPVQVKPEVEVDINQNETVKSQEKEKAF